MSRVQPEDWGRPAGTKATSVIGRGRWRPIQRTQLVTFVALWLLVMLLAGGGGPPILAFLAPRVALAAPELVARPGYFGQVPPNG